MEPVDPERVLARLLEAERAVGPGPGAQSRDLRRLNAALGAGVPALAIGSITLNTSSALAKLGSGLVVGLVVGVGAAAGVQGFVTSHERFAKSPPLAPPIIAGARSQATLQHLPPSLSPSASPSAAAPPALEPLPSRLQPRRLEPQPVPSAAPVGSTLDEELRLIELAKREVDAGHPHLARIWLSDHQARYPKGIFAVERQALSTLVDCAEHAPHAAQAAVDFARAFPSSPFIDRIRSACPDAKLE